MGRASLLASVLLLSSCGAVSAPPDSSVPPTELPPIVPVSSLFTDDANRYVPKWQEPPRANALLRRLVLDLVVAVQAKDVDALRTSLTATGFADLEKGCGSTPLADCLKPLPSFFVEKITLDDDTHATILTKQITESGEFAPGFELHAELSADGPQLTSLPQ